MSTKRRTFIIHNALIIHNTLIIYNALIIHNYPCSLSPRDLRIG